MAVSQWSPFAAVAIALAWSGNQTVLGLVAYAWAGFGAAFGPLLLLSLFWRGMRGAGALAAMLGGGVTVILWRQLEGGLFELYEMVPGVIVASLCAIVFSQGAGSYQGGDDPDPA